MNKLGILRFLWLTAVSFWAASSFGQSDELHLDGGQLLAGASGTFRLYLRDVAGSGIDTGVENVGGVLLKMQVPPGTVDSVSITADGLSAGHVFFENTTFMNDEIHYQLIYQVAGVPFFNLGASAPGDPIATMSLTAAAGAGGQTISFTPVASDTAIQDELGTTINSVANGKLTVFLGNIAVLTSGINPPTINVFDATPETIVAGNSCTLSWNVLEADDVSIDQGVGVVPATSSLSVSPVATTTYTLTASNTIGQSQASVTLNVLALDSRNDIFLSHFNSNGNQVFFQMNGLLVDSGQILGEYVTWDTTARDFDRDGAIDVLAANGSFIRFWWNDGSRFFTSHDDFSVAARSCDAGDIDNDGDVDAVILGDELTIIDNQIGSFTTRVIGTLTSYEMTDVSLADLNGDGFLDVVIGRTGPDPEFRENIVLLNDGLGSFTDSGIRLGTNHTYDIALADFNRDGNVDIYCANFENGLNQPEPDTIYFNLGSASFGPAVELAPFRSVKVATGDFNRDGWMDVVTTSDSTDPSYLCLNNGAIGTFTCSALGLRANTRSISARDLTGNGFLDLFASGNASSQANTYYLNDGALGFMDSSVVLSNLDSRAHAVADFRRPGAVYLLIYTWPTPHIDAIIAAFAD